MKYIAIGCLAGIGLGFCVGGHALAAPTERACQARHNDTLARLVECIQKDVLWHRLTAFQKIADENPGANGHGNRDTGTPGYRASVDYVARLMRKAGYRVTIQPYEWQHFGVAAAPEFAAGGKRYALMQDWFVARLSGSGSVVAPVQPVGEKADGDDSNTGCSPEDFDGFTRGNIALLRRGSCAYDTQVSNAEAAGAAAVIIYNCEGTPGVSAGRQRRDGAAFEAQLVAPADVPVVGVAAHAVGAELVGQYREGNAPQVRLDIRTRTRSDIDYNVIADSPFGDADRIVVIDAHLDSIYGAGMLDNASGSATILETALQLAHTRTRNRLRYIWFGGEELGLLGSHYYTRALSPGELRRIVFDVDVDVTATPNFDVLVADPANAFNVKRFPPDVVPDSKVGNDAFADYFRSVGIDSRNASFGNDGTDSNSFSLVGVPDSGILTQQDCCKHDWEVDLWGGYRGDYEGKVPGRNGGCVDRPRRWCDNLSNNDPFVLEFVSKAVAAVTLTLANDARLGAMP